MADRPPADPPDARPVIVFDGVCVLCNRSVDFILKRDPRGRFRLAASQSPAGRALLHSRGINPDDVSTVYLIEPGGAFTRSSAALRILSGLRFPWPLAGIFRLVPRPLRDAVYRLVASHRYRWFGRRDSCRLRAPADRGRLLESESDLAGFPGLAAPAGAHSGNTSPA